MLKMSRMTWKSYTIEHNLRNCNNGIMVLLKASRKTMCHKDATIFRNMHCVPLSIINTLTEPFSVLKVNGKKAKGLVFD